LGAEASQEIGKRFETINQGGISMNRLTPEETLGLFKKHNLEPITGCINPIDGEGKCCGLGAKLVDVGFNFKNYEAGSAYDAAYELLGHDYADGYWRGFDMAGEYEYDDDWLRDRMGFYTQLSEELAQGFRDGFESRKLVDRELS
jgi:hypothetical protein